jgi:PAS domain S-box-containing protein
MPLRLQGRIDRVWRFLALAIVLLIALLFYLDWGSVERDTERLEFARQLQEGTNTLIADVTDAETAERGYLLTGNPVYLSSYRTAIADVPKAMDALAATVKNAPSSAKRNSHTAVEDLQVKGLRLLVDAKLSAMRRSIDVRDQQGPDEAFDVVRSDEGRLVMEQLRSSAKMLNNSEKYGLWESSKASSNDWNRSRIIVLVGSLGLVFLLWRLGRAVDTVVREREDLAQKIDDARYLLETTLASIGDAVIVTNATGLVRFMNPGAERLTGWTMSLARERPLNDIFATVDDSSGKPIEDPFRLLQLESHESARMELVLVAKDGTRRPIEDTSAPIRDHVGKILGMVLVFRDVSGRRSAERDLKRWKETFSSAGFGMFLADSRTGEIVDLNPTFASMHGYSVNELLGKGLHALVSKDSAPKLSEGLQAAVLKGRNMFEVPHVRRDGSEFTGFVDVTRFYMNRAEYLAGYCSDITERKRFEDAIKESEERFRTLASALPQLIWSTDALGRIDYVNQVWVNFAGWTSGDEARKYVPQSPWQDLLHPDDSPEYFARWRAALEQATTFEVEARLRGASDPGYRWFLFRAVPIFDRGGRIVRWLGGCTDIQQQKEAAAQLKAAVEALQLSNSELEQFAYAASHDLQEPLRMVSIYSELLQEEYSGKLDVQAASYIEFAVNGAQRMSHLLKGLLAYSRVSNAPQHASIADCGAAVRAALLNLARPIEETHARIEVGELPAVNISDVHLVQLFQNLIGNALKYRKEQPDAEPPHIKISAKPHVYDGTWLFAVSDNGIGIEPEYRDQIFGIFKRLHGSSIEGTGIGLALCQKIVERAGGRIWVESEPGKGSTFFFTLQGVETGEHALAYHNTAGRG